LGILLFVPLHYGFSPDFPPFAKSAKDGAPRYRDEVPGPAKPENNAYGLELSTRESGNYTAIAAPIWATVRYSRKLRHS
jgi:hypothetical protein